MQGLDNYYNGLLADHQRSIDEQAYKEEEMGKLKDKIIELLDDHHFAELSHLTGEDDLVCRKLVHQIRKDGGLHSPEYWQAEYVGHLGGHAWAIYGKEFSGEYIDANGDCLCFYTKEEADDYIKEEIK